MRMHHAYASRVHTLRYVFSGLFGEYGIKIKV